MKTIQYMGSKDKILPFLDACFTHYLQDFSIENSKVLFDAFAGSGRVSYYFRHRFTVVSADKLHFPKTILSSYLCTPYQPQHFQEKINILNNLPDSFFAKTDKWFTETYGGDWNDGKSEDINGVKKIWLDKNSRKIDSIRTQIQLWKDNNEITEAEENVLLLALILGINKISNVVGHQNGYLKTWCFNAQNDLLLTIPDIEMTKNSAHKQFVGDIFEIIDKVQADIAYFDPPYGTNNKKIAVSTRYSSFYHLWNTLVTNERPCVFGKAHKPIQTKGYTEAMERNKREVVIPKFIRLIEEVRASIVAFSYSNQGLLTAKDFAEIYRLAGCDMDTYRVYTIPHVVNNQSKLAKKDGAWIDRESHTEDLIEYLFIACKNPLRYAMKERTTTPNLSVDIESIPVVDAWLKQPISSTLPSPRWEYREDGWYRIKDHT